MECSPLTAFQSTRPSRASTLQTQEGAILRIFQSTRPSRASTPHCSVIHHFTHISIHKALTGLDHLGSKYGCCPQTFQSTRPSRASTFLLSHAVCNPIFQSTRPSRASTKVRYNVITPTRISIHKALTGLDVQHQRIREIISISIHKALTGLDLVRKKLFRLLPHFNPQGPHGPRLACFGILCSNIRHFNPQGPHGPRRRRARE